MFEYFRKLLDYGNSSQRVLAYRNDVINLANLSYDEGVRTIASIMSNLNHEDRDSFANLIKFMSRELTNNGHPLHGAQLMKLWPSARQMADD